MSEIFSVGYKQYTVKKARTFIRFVRKTLPFRAGMDSTDAVASKLVRCLLLLNILPNDRYRCATATPCKIAG
jgi:hypothetical protein